MTTSTDGGPAFPHDVRQEITASNGEVYIGDTSRQHGLSRLDYFAAKAMQGERKAWAYAMSDPGGCLHTRLTGSEMEAIARDAYIQAAAMLAESERRGA